MQALKPDILLTEFRRVVEFPDKDYLRILPLAEPVEIKKNEHLFRAGELANKIYFVEKGCMRQYYVNSNGDERNIYFKTEGGWASELISFFNNTPTELNLQALEPCKALVFNQKNWMYGMANIKPFMFYFIKAQQETNFMLKKRLGEATVESPEQKYIRFVKEEPHLLKRIPLFHIAAYLGMTPETLSRIRNKLARK